MDAGPCSEALALTHSLHTGVPVTLMIGSVIPTLTLQRGKSGRVRVAPPVSCNKQSWTPEHLSQCRSGLPRLAESVPVLSQVLCGSLMLDRTIPPTEKAHVLVWPSPSSPHRGTYCLLGAWGYFTILYRHLFPLNSRKLNTGVMFECLIRWEKRHHPLYFNPPHCLHTH